MARKALNSPQSTIVDAGVRQTIQRPLQHFSGEAAAARRELRAAREASLSRAQSLLIAFRSPPLLSFGDRRLPEQLFSWFGNDFPKLWCDGRAVELVGLRRV